MSLPNSVMYCDVQLTRDNLGVCVSGVNIDLSTTAAMAYPKGEKTFKVNGQDVRGWYALDYNLEDLKNTTFCKFCSIISMTTKTRSCVALMLFVLLDRCTRYTKSTNCIRWNVSSFFTR